MTARSAVLVCLLSAALWALWPVPATAQVIHQQVTVGSRVFGPPPAGTLVGGTVAVGARHYYSTGQAWQGGRYWYQPSYDYGYYGPWGYGGWGYGGWGYGGWGYPGWGYPYGGWYRPYFRPAPVILPPVVIPAEQIFGPAAAARMLGVDLFGQGGFGQAGFGQAGFVPLRPEVIAAREAARVDRDEKPAFVSNPTARQRAARFMELGDGYFAQGNYVLAYDRYKSAVQATPDLVEPYLRRGQALIAMQSYDLASDTYLHAFKLHPNWAKTAFRLDTVYGNRQREKQDHLDALAAAAERQPTAELMFLVGAQLLYDGQAERSLKFFDRAKELPRRDPLPLPAGGEKKAPLDVQPAAAPKPAVKQQGRDQPAVF
jgi:tetratricopeptide (TPR) repeat protein